MVEVLRAFEDALPGWLGDPSGWSSLDVDYHPPRVERLYRAFGTGRGYLHVVHPCDEGAALVHPHPWPSAMRVLTGRYEMGVAYGPGPAAPPVAARLIAEGPMVYEMTDPDAWHWVRPIGGPALTLMVTGPPWSRSAPRPTRPLSPLPPARVDEVLALFRAILGG